MQRNDYRRALIMLRSLLNGYSGHARIEIRTLTGNLSIRASVPQGAQSVRAALVGRRSALYYAHPLGNLRRDMRGQAGLSVTFDPRDVGGRGLEAYSLLAIVTINDGVCELALVGNLNGSCENDWSRVRDVVCALYAPQPRPDETPEAVPYAREAPAVEEIPEVFEENTQDDSADETNDGGLVWDLSVPDEETADAPDETAVPETVSETAEGVPELFRQEGWSYTRTALPAGCGYAYSYVGTPACGGEICVAIPGNFDTEPPAGLDDYQWIGDSGAGWWIKCYEARTY